MTIYDNEEPIDPGLRQSYPCMTDEQIREVQRNLRRYVQVIITIYDRLKAEGKKWPAPLTPAELEKRLQQPPKLHGNVLQSQQNGLKS